jgi:tetratricopeptide (TPR) repeat protein
VLLPALTLWLSAAPTAADATRLAKSHSWEELYLAWAAVDAKGYRKKDAAAIGKALAQGCAALLGEDAVMAYALGEKGAAFSPSAEGLYCLGLAARHLEQRDAAERAFRDGMKRYPKDGRFPLEVGRLLLEEGDAAGATAVLRAVPPKAKEAKEAQALLAGALEPKAEAKAGAAVSSPAPMGEVPGPVNRSPSRPPPSTSASGLGYESSIDGEGRRVRQNSYFRFLYFNAQRDFGQRADYEGRVQAALEEARTAARRLMGVAREQPVDVILYSREEFRLHHGPQAAAAIAGFYAEHAIRMNDSAEITPRTQATLVHEYVHAVVDELAAFNPSALPTWLHEGIASYVEWRYQGQDRPLLVQAKALGALARQKQLPSVKGMSRGPLIGMSNPSVAYALAGCAVRWMVQKAGMAAVIEVIRDAGQGTPFEQAFERHMGKDLSHLDEELQSELSTF